MRYNIVTLFPKHHQHYVFRPINRATTYYKTTSTQSQPLRASASALAIRDHVKSSRCTFSRSAFAAAGSKKGNCLLHGKKAKCSGAPASAPGTFGGPTLFSRGGLGSCFLAASLNFRLVTVASSYFENTQMMAFSVARSNVPGRTFCADVSVVKIGGGSFKR